MSPTDGGLTPPSTLIIGGVEGFHRRLCCVVLERHGFATSELGASGAQQAGTSPAAAGDGAVSVRSLARDFARHLERAGLRAADVGLFAPNLSPAGPRSEIEVPMRHELEAAGHADARFAFFPAGRGDDYELASALRVELFHALILADLLTEVACRVRPYELEPGATDAAIREAEDTLAAALAAARPVDVPASLVSRGLARFTRMGDATTIARVGFERSREDFLGPLRAAAERLQEHVEVDYSRARPRVRLEGRWFPRVAGPGGAALVRFLEAEGVEVQPGEAAEWVLRTADRFDWLARRWLRQRLQPYRELFPGVYAPDGSLWPADLRIVLDPESTPRLSAEPGTVRATLVAGEDPARSEGAERIRTALRGAVRACDEAASGLLETLHLDLGDLGRFVQDRRDLRRPLQPLEAPRSSGSTASLAFLDHAGGSLAREKGMRKEIHWHP